LVKSLCDLIVPPKTIWSALRAALLLRPFAVYGYDSSAGLTIRPMMNFTAGHKKSPGR
jgi:hypothetical protein